MGDRDHGYEGEVAEPWICCRFCTTVFQATGQGVVRVLHHEINQHREQCEQNQQSNYYRIFQLQELRVDARPESPLRGFAFELSAKDYDSSTTTVATPSPSAPLFPSHAQVSGDTTCPICSKYFIDARNLQKHMELHKGQGGLSCQFCGKQFRHPDLLDQHMAECHDKEAPFNCSHCTAKFKSREKSNDHVRQIHSESPASATRHVDRVYAPVDCSICGLTLFHKRNLLRHHRNSHPDVELPNRTVAVAECNDHVRQTHSESASKKFSRVKVTKNIDRRKSSSAPVDCSVCGLTQYHKWNLLRHHRTSHPGVEFPKASAIAMHRMKESSGPPRTPKVHSNNPEEPGTLTPCQICGAAFPLSVLKSHVASHRLECHICGRDDIPVAQMVEHGITHLGESLKCPDPTGECTHVTNRRRRAWEHWNRHLKVQPVICLSCGEAFVTADDRRRHHVRVHLGIKGDRKYPGEVSNNAARRWRSRRERDRIRKREARARARLQKAQAQAAAGAGAGIPPPTGTILSVNACVLCGRGLSSSRSLVRHLLHVHGVTPKPKVASQNSTAPDLHVPGEARRRLHPMSSADEEDHHNPAAGEILPIASIYDQWEEPMPTNKNPSEPAPGPASLQPSEPSRRSTARKRVRARFVLKSREGPSTPGNRQRHTPSACGICRRVLSSERNVKRHLIEVHKLPIEEAIAMPTIPRPEAQLSKSLRAAAAPMASSPSKKKMKKIRKEGSHFRGRLVPVTCEICGRVLSHQRSLHRHQVLVHGMLIGDWRKFYKQNGRTVPGIEVASPQPMEEGTQTAGGEGDLEQPTINVKIEELEAMREETPIDATTAEGGATESIGGDWPHEAEPPEPQQEIPEAERLVHIVKIEGGVDESNREEPEAPLPPFEVMGSNGVLLLKVEID